MGIRWLRQRKVHKLMMQNIERTVELFEKAVFQEQSLVSLSKEYGIKPSRICRLLQWFKNMLLNPAIWAGERKHKFSHNLWSMRKEKEFWREVLENYIIILV